MFSALFYYRLYIGTYLRTCVFKVRPPINVPIGSYVFRIPLLRFLSTKTKFIQTKYSINEVPIPDIYLARIFTDFDNFQIRYCARLKFVAFYAIPLSERNSIQTVKFISVPVSEFRFYCNIFAGIL